MRWGRALTELWSQGLGRAIDAVRVNAVTADATFWVKRRRFGMGAVIAAGNVFLRLSRSRIRMFASCSRWQEWELASFRLLHPGHAAELRRGGAVALEALPGESLDRLLARGQLTAQGVEAAARELRRAHALVLPGAAVPWSHGDMHLKNVLYDADGQRAWLIDFETAHEADLSAEERHADDLFVFLLDLAGRAPEDVAEVLAGAFLRAYGREDVLRALLARLQPPRGLERALWKSRSQHLREARLLRWLEFLRREVLGLTRTDR
ncbi:lipopolysaccharide kinase InaA family protein [Myxococcus sp. RHSTA-1-4]|uniref:lipopolysaccharide kinase InaA family protein n=1 Tax=Myxococcus sp. RHSTA-1-4 TaxID=2874601 RepID=UPI001CBDAB7E